MATRWSISLTFRGGRGHIHNRLALGADKYLPGLDSY